MTTMTPEELETGYLESLNTAPDFTPVDAKELRAVLGNPAVKAVLKKLLTTHESRCYSIGAHSDLSKEEGVKIALRLQGEARGLRNAVLFITSLAFKENEDAGNAS